MLIEHDRNDVRLIHNDIDNREQRIRVIRSHPRQRIKVAEFERDDQIEARFGRSAEKLLAFANRIGRFDGHDLDAKILRRQRQPRKCRVVI